MPSWTTEQLDAINKTGSNIIVSAGAGSGKTAVLTERVINKIKNGISVDRLLILTFTKAAANEMKERIRDAIIKERLDEQLKLLDCAYITTFDSYALSVVKKYHYLINVSKNINIGNENVFLIEKKKILDNIFERLYKENNPKFIKLIKEQCVKDDDDIREYILNIRNKLDMKVESNKYLTNYISNYYSDENINKFVQEYLEFLKEKIKNINDALDDFSYYADGELYSKFEDSLISLIKSDNYNDIEINSNVKLPRLPQGSEMLVKEKKELISGYLKDLKSYLKYKTLDELKLNLYKTKEYAEIIVEILLEIDNRIKLFKFNNDIYEFNDIAMLAIDILKNNPDICLELKNSFSEILVDEYQDTSDIQEIFINLIANNNVYMVGDIKQSIYRFRNANPYIFKNKYDLYAEAKGGIKIDLTKNFRSRLEVVNNINLMFNYVMDDLIGGANYSHDHQMIFGNKAYIESGNNNLNNNMEVFSYDYSQYQFNKNEVEAFIVAEDIRKKINDNYQVFDKKTGALRKCNYSDFVILMDRTTDFELYKKIFEYHNIPLMIYKDEVVNNEFDSMVISNLLSLIKQIKEKNYDKKFQYLFTSIARSFICEMSDQKIFDIINNNDFYNTDLFLKCQSISNTLDSSTPRELLDLVLKEFNIYENIIKIGNIKPAIMRIEQFYSLSSDLMNIGYDCYKFIDYINEINNEGYQIKYSGSVDNIDAVRIMTIHKSKGLEYPICYFSGLYKAFNISDLKEKILFDNYFGIILPYFDEGIEETICKELLKDRYIKEEISEKIRLFYVALTRAREKIILIIPKKEIDFTVEKVVSNNERLKYRTLADIIYSLGSVLSPYLKEINLNDLNITKDYQNSIIKNLDSIEDKFYSKIELNELSIEPKYVEDASFSKKIHTIITKENQKNIELGLELHSILENLDFHNPNFDLIDNKFYKNKIKKFYESLDNIDKSKVYQEYEFVYSNGDIKYHGIIDLMLEYDDHIDIIDYKLKDISDLAYIQQLNGYRNYIMTISNKPVNLYLYSLLDEKFTKLI